MEEMDLRVIMHMVFFNQQNNIKLYKMGCCTPRTCQVSDPEDNKITRSEYYKENETLEERIKRLEEDNNWINIQLQQVFRDNLIITEERKKSFRSKAREKAISSSHK